MQLQDIVTRVRKTVGEPEPNGYGSQQVGQGTWDNSQIIGYINEALGIMARNWRKEKSTTVSITSVGQTDFAFPTDMLEDGLRKVYYTSNNVNYPVSFVNLDTYSGIAATNSPVIVSFYYYRYTVWGSTIKFFPGAANITDTITLYYYKTPATLVNATDIPDIPARFHTALAYYGIKECQNAVEEVGLESDAEQKWIQELNEFKKEMSRNQRDQNVRARSRR